MIPDADLYAAPVQQSIFSPWLSDRGEYRQVYDRGSPRSLVPMDRCYVLYSLLRQAIHLDGEIWECGTYKGGTAAMIAEVCKRRGLAKTIRVFDTFAGLPEADPFIDLHTVGQFDDTEPQAVEEFVDYEELRIHQGTIPQSLRFDFSGRVAFLHIDLDTYFSTLLCLQEVWPLVMQGGIVVNDDYGFPSCPGARRAVDEFFADKRCVPLCLPTGQAVVFKGVT